MKICTTFLAIVPVTTKDKSFSLSGGIDIGGIDKTSYGIELSSDTTGTLTKWLRPEQWYESIASVCVLIILESN